MCGRITLYTEPARIARRFKAALTSDLGDAAEPRWNVPPTQTVLALVHITPEKAASTHPALELPDSGLLLQSFRWGLLPWWAKDLSIGNRQFNARAETLRKKPAFKSSLESKRCLVVADGFYEWKKEPSADKSGGRRMPYYFTRRDGATICFAGLWENWRDPTIPREKRPRLRTCTIITAASGPDIRDVHDRMPVIVEPESFDVWLHDGELADDQIASVLHPSPGGTLVSTRVGTDVNSVRNEGPSLIESAP